MPRLSWPAAIGVALVTGVVGVLAVGVLAEQWSRWYAWSTFEGAAGYAVVGLALLGGLASLVLGLVVARVGGAAAATFLRALGTACGLVLGAVGVVGVAGRALADVPPRIGGEALMLVVELRWPAAHRQPPAVPTGDAVVRLGRRTLGGLAAVERGMLWPADARRDGDRWVAPGAVPIGTARGRRVVEVVLDEAREDAAARTFVIPLPGNPGPADTAWSAWVPDGRDGGRAAGDGFALRYRVQPRGGVVRRETVGPFAVDLLADGFVLRRLDDGRVATAPLGRYAIRHRGRPVRVRRPSSTDGAAEVSAIGAVASLGGPRPALLVEADAWGGGTGGLLALVVDAGDSARVVPLGRPTRPDLAVDALGGDGAPSASRTARPGGVDRTLLAAPGPYLVGDALLDTRTLAVRRVPTDTTLTVDPHRPPLALSPDGRSVVRFAERVGPDTETGTERAPVLLVADVDAGTTYVVPIDRGRMRYPDERALDRAWLAHHFAWARAGGGADRLVARAGVAPLPHRGWLSEDSPGHPSYTLAPVRGAMRAALIALLVAELGAEPLAPSAGGYVHPVRIDGRVLDVVNAEEIASVVVSVPAMHVDSGLVRRVAGVVDAALATGRYDRLFHR